MRISPVGTPFCRSIQLIFAAILENGGVNNNCWKVLYKQKKGRSHELCFFAFDFLSHLPIDDTLYGIPCILQNSYYTNTKYHSFLSDINTKYVFVFLMAKCKVRKPYRISQNDSSLIKLLSKQAAVVWRTGLDECLLWVWLVSSITAIHQSAAVVSLKLVSSPTAATTCSTITLNSCPTSTLLQLRLVNKLLYLYLWLSQIVYEYPFTAK